MALHMGTTTQSVLVTLHTAAWKGGGLLGLPCVARLPALQGHGYHGTSTLRQTARRRRTAQTFSARRPLGSGQNQRPRLSCLCTTPAQQRQTTRSALEDTARSASASASASPPASPPASASPPPPPPPILPQYRPPRKGLLALLPASWVPYAELIRLDKPTGTYYLFLPCLFSTLVAAPLAHPVASPPTVLATSALFFTGALVMRGAGCTINDLWDRNLDPHVARTRLRPIARGAVPPFNALVFTGAQLLTGLAVLLHFPASCLYYAVPSLALVATYPLAKRVTHYPQLVLGLTFSWGAILGFPALGVDLLSHPPALAAASLLYASCVSWTVLYDMIYAHMDIKDDVKAGIRSIALRHEHNTKAVLAGLAAAQVALLAAAGAAAGAGPLFFAGSCGAAAVSLGTMIWSVRLKEVANCWWWFRYGCWFTGGGIAAGLAADYLARLVEERRQGAGETPFRSIDDPAS